MIEKDAVRQAVEATSAEEVLIYLYHIAGVEYKTLRRAAADIGHIRADPKGLRELIQRVEQALHQQTPDRTPQ